MLSGLEDYLLYLGYKEDTKRWHMHFDIVQERILCSMRMQWNLKTGLVCKHCTQHDQFHFELVLVCTEDKMHFPVLVEIDQSHITGTL